MLKLPTLLLSVLISIGLILQPARAESGSPAPPTTLRDTAEKADVIVVGQVQHDSESHGDSGNYSPGCFQPFRAVGAHKYTVSVDHVLKGSRSIMPGAILVNFNTPTSKPADYQEPFQGSYGLFMLRNGQSGNCFFVNDHSFFEIAKFAEAKDASAGDLFIETVHQLANFLGTPIETDRSHDKLCGFRGCYAHAYREAAKVVKTVPYKLVRDDLHAIANSSKVSPLQSLLAIDCLFSMGDFRNQDKVRELLVKPLPGAGESCDFTGSWVPSISESAHIQMLPSIHTWILSKPEFVPQLVEPLRSDNVGVRRQAACVLCEIGTPATIAPLSQVALKDGDLTVQYFTVKGLATATGVGCEYGYWGQFFENQAPQLIKFWRWWTDCKDNSGSPLSVAKLEDARPNFAYTRKVNLANGVPSLPHDIEQSDLIVAGSLAPVDKPGFAPGKYRRIVVDRILKNVGQNRLDDIVVSIEYGAAKNSGIFLLNRQENGTYRSDCSAYLWGLPQAPGKVGLSEVSSQSPLSKIASEMIGILQSPQGKLVPDDGIKRSGPAHVAVAAITMVPGMRGEVRAVPVSVPVMVPQQIPQFNASPDDEVYAQAASALMALPYQDVVSMLQSALRSSQLEDQSKLWIAKVLFSFGDYDALSLVKPLLLAQPPLSETTDFIVRALADDIKNFCFHEQPALAKSSLTRKGSVMTELMHSKRVEVRRAAASNLRTLASSGDAGRDIIVETLAKIGLYDPDMDVRYLSVAGLEGVASSIIYKHCEYDYAAFKRNQAEYVGRMRQWATLRPKSYPDYDNISSLRSSLQSKDAASLSYVFSLAAEGVVVLAGVVNFVLGAMRQELVLPFARRRVSANSRMAIGLALLVIGLTIPGALVWLVDAAQGANLWK